MSPRKKRGFRSGDWRTDAQRAEDRDLEGTWFRCRDHGQVTARSAIVLGERAYCPADECAQALLLVSSAMAIIAPGTWNSIKQPTVPPPG